MTTAAPTFSHGSKGRLTDRDLGRFPGYGLFDRVGRVVCHAGCLPRKELFEAWEVARRVRRICRGGLVVDLGAGHGLLAHLMLLLDDTSPSAVVADKALPPSAAKLHAAIAGAWPRLAQRVTFASNAIHEVELTESDLVVSSHACGALTDAILCRAVAARARVAVLPCCHHASAARTRTLAGWVNAALAIDIERALMLERAGYRVRTQTISAEITPKNRLLIGEPA